MHHRSLSLMALVLVVLLAFAGCAAEKAPEAKEVDLTATYEAVGAAHELPPSLTLMDAETMEAFYPGIGALELPQVQIYTPMMTGVAYEIAMAECADAEQVKAVETIFNDRVTAQAEGGAWYPESMEVWSKGVVKTYGNYVVLLVAGDDQDNVLKTLEAQFQ